MSEYWIGLVFSVQLVFLIGGATLYWLGGRSNLWIRRWIATLILTAGVNVGGLMLHNWSWMMLLFYPALVASFSMGYGGDSQAEKLWKRTCFAAYYVLFVGGVTALVGLVGRAPFGVVGSLVVAEAIAVGLSSASAAVVNPVHAPTEEGSLCLVMGLGPMLVPHLLNFGG